jgi:hypothetical protein
MLILPLNRLKAENKGSRSRSRIKVVSIIMHSSLFIYLWLTSLMISYLLPSSAENVSEPGNGNKGKQEGSALSSPIRANPNTRPHKTPTHTHNGMNLSSPSSPTGTRIRSHCSFPLLPPCDNCCRRGRSLEEGASYLYRPPPKCNSRRETYRQ